MINLGDTAADFNLTDVISGKNISLSDFKDSKALLIIFMCNHCPYVKHVENEIANIANDYKDQGLSVVGISANDAVEYPDDSPEKLKEQAERLDFNFPYLYDEDQTVAKAYGAKCTPDPFLFDNDKSLVYRGQFDDSRPGNDIPVSGSDLRTAIQAVLNNSPVDQNQKPSTGCSIKWKE
ncbi:MAG: thioredoxin family protein [Patescibacteria group bacterium]